MEFITEARGRDNRRGVGRGGPAQGAVFLRRRRAGAPDGPGRVRRRRRAEGGASRSRRACAPTIPGKGQGRRGRRRRSRRRGGSRRAGRGAAEDTEGGRRGRGCDARGLGTGVVPLLASLRHVARSSVPGRGRPRGGRARAGTAGQRSLSGRAGGTAGGARRRRRRECDPSPRELRPAGPWPRRWSRKSQGGGKDARRRDVPGVLAHGRGPRAPSAAVAAAVLGRGRDVDRRRRRGCLDLGRSGQGRPSRWGGGAPDGRWTVVPARHGLGVAPPR